MTFSSVPLVSVIIPCYNLGAYLDQAVQSVLDQTYHDFEILIIDDGSTDPATQYLFASYQRPKTRILRTENQGLAKSRNLGIQEARGRYIACLDADDQFEPTFLERTVDALERDSAIAFASCWLKAFGGGQFSWNPTRCDLPHLLVEDTVCTAALMRKEALLEVGGFDANMPVAGYEDWDLAITLVERALRGIILPEYLFRYRIRAGSMSAHCTEPANHALLIRYIVEKHAETYRQNVLGALETIEQRTVEMECYGRHTIPAENPVQKQHIELLEHYCHSVLKSRSWKLLRPLRRTYGQLKSFSRYLNRFHGGAPRISAVITCRDQGRQLSAAMESAQRQMSPEDEIVIVDDGSSDSLTLQILEWYQEAGYPLVRTSSVGFCRAREAGLNKARAPVLFAMGADETVEPTYFSKAIHTLQSDSEIAFVCCGLREEATGFTWLPESADLAGLVACPRIGFPILRRECLSTVGGYDVSLATPAQADWELAIRLAAQGKKGAIIHEPLLHRHSGCVIAPIRSCGEISDLLVRRVCEKHGAIFEQYWTEAILGQENQRRRLQAHVEGTELEKDGQPVNWGELRRLEPVSAMWGIDRGQPVDRYYIEQFLSHRREYIHGRVLEVKDPGYTRAYGQGVEVSDVLDVAQDNPSATLICDLAAKGSLPENKYDCFILTQTIHIIYETRTVIENAYRALRPGGVLLATLPCVSRVDYESSVEGDCWRFTSASARRLFEEVFGFGQVEIESCGNVLVCTSFLMGLSATELTPEELNYRDPYFPLLICVRAVKAKRMFLGAGTGARASQQKAVVLLYHRVARSSHDRWSLCVSPENFTAHMKSLRSRFKPVHLTEITAMLEGGGVQHGSAAVTFDDGYRDNFTTAIPILKQMGVPATFFISGDGALDGASFWWERLDGSLRLMELDRGAAERLHRTLMAADLEERNRILSELPQPKQPLPQRLSPDELEALAREPLADLGAHGWSHRLLAELSVEGQRQEVMWSIRMVSNLTGSAVQSFAYPFGGPVTTATGNVLREAGIRAACTVVDAAVTSGCDPLAIPRLDVKNWGEEEFEARLRSLLDG